jgi:hypothetical protein
MAQDPAVRQEAASRLHGLFSVLGQGQSSTTGGLGGLAGQLEEFAEMPMELARIFTDMALQLTELVLKSLEEGGIVLVKGLTP